MSDVPEVPWAEFWPQFCRDYRYKPGDAEHVSIIGPTATGKSTLAIEVAKRRHYVAALLVKGQDDVMLSKLRAAKFRPARTIPSPSPGGRRVYVWPRYRGLGDAGPQRLALGAAMDDAFAAGVWHLLLDEGQHMVDKLKLDDRIKDWLRLGRTQGNGLILCCQRPSYMPRDIYSAPRHLFLFGTNDERDLRSISGLNGVSNRIVRDTVAGLGKSHRVLYVNTGDGSMAVTRYEKGRF